MRTCKWHILPRNVCNKRSASRINPTPHLFCIFINELPMCVTLPSVQCDLFAEDGTLNTSIDNIYNIRRDLQQNLNDISGWCCRNWMALNPTKTKCKLMVTRQKHQNQQLSLNLNFETTPIEQVSKVAQAY